MNWRPDFFQEGQYEFTIVANDGGLVLNSKGLKVESTDSETFSVSVKNSNRAPVLAKIDDQIINENEALIDINANDNSSLVLEPKKVRPNNPIKGEDEDIDLQKLSYQCSIKEEKEKSFRACQSPIRGMTFDSDKGLLKWKTDYFHSGKYDVKITAQDNDKDDPKESFQEFKVEVKNINRAPKLAKIDNQIINEMTELKLVNSNDISSLVVPINQARVKTPTKSGPKNNDEDIDLQDLTLQLSFDQLVDGKVTTSGKGFNCTSLKGVKFDSKTGKMNWKPDYTQSGRYEFKVTAIDNDPKPLKGSQTFSVEVKNINRSPKLFPIGNQEISENQKMSEIDANDQLGKGDKDIDQEVLTYDCYFDQDLNKKLDGLKKCSSLRRSPFLLKRGR